MRVLVCILGTVILVTFQPRAQEIRPLATPADVTRALGIPTEVRVDGDVTTWIYSSHSPVIFVRGRVTSENLPEPRATPETVWLTADDNYLYHSADCQELRQRGGRAVALSTLDRMKYHPHTCFERSSKQVTTTPSASNNFASLRALAIHYYHANDFEKAFDFARRCLEAHPTTEECVNIHRDTKNHLISWVQSELAQLDSNDLYSRLSLLRKGLEISPQDPTFAAPLVTTTKLLDQVRSDAHAYIERIPNSTITGLPSTLKPFLDTVPEVMAAKVAHDTRSALLDSSAALSEGDFAKAYTTVEPLAANPEATQLLKRITSTAESQLSTELAALTAKSTLEDIRAFANSLDRFKGAVSAERISDARIAAGRAALSAISRTIAIGDLPTSPERDRFLMAVLQHTSPGLATALKSADSSLSIVARAAAQLILATQGSSACGGLGALSDGVQGILSTVFTPLDSADIRVTVRDPQCSIDTEEGSAEPVSSRYVATYQQDVNPIYVQLQSALQIAQARVAQIKAEHAINPPQNGWAAAANAVQEGVAQSEVNRIVRQLEATPPFLSRPVELEYTAYRVPTRRTAGVTLTVSLDDRVSGFGDAVQVVGTSESSGFALKGVNARDSQHLSNREAVLDSPKVLLRKALSTVEANLGASFRQLARRMFLARAAIAFRSKSPKATVLGDLLLARDVEGFVSPDLDPYATIYRQLASMTAENVGTITLDGSIFPVARRRTPSGGRSTGELHSRERTGMVQRSLDAVVLVTAGDKLGSGFFVSNDGLLITNEHVISGARTIAIKTSQGESYLATPISVSQDHDLALLKTAAAPAVWLSFGDSDAVAVGDDVIAIGSPFGLQGTVTKGIVSAIRKFDDGTFFQIDAAINSGNSGGPLLTNAGKVIGINTLKLMRNGAESLGFAISGNDAREIFETYLK